MSVVEFRASSASGASASRTAQAPGRRRRVTVSPDGEGPEKSAGRDTNATPAFRARLSGSVQGVGFRAWTRLESLRLGLNGYVRNRADGSVEIVASGDRTALEELLTRLRRGPPAGAVLSVDVEWPAPGTLRRAGLEVPDGFEIRF
ncbi:MAG: acylphosphatase [Chloroflexi bacterium]|nr:acylphosphatase [Chloroflexota bacterium]